MEEQESYPPDSDDVREQIEQQRLLAAQLKERLEQDELQLASKEQQNELLKSKLSLLKSRSKAKRTSGANDKDDRKNKLTKDQSGVSPINTARKQSTNSANKGKINILREQLEQNRLRFERHGLELSEDTRSMEAMVEQLRHELEERDSAIQQLQAGQVPQVLQQEQISEPVDISIILQQKEQEVKTLTGQVTNLQNVILELQENLKEKDCVIEARTQAISLLSEDMSKKWRANVDMLEETRQQMQMMQENFVQIEAGLKIEIKQLNGQLQNNALKLAQAEQNVKAAETARADLASQNAELLKKINNLNETPKEISELQVANAKIDELSQALSEANKLTVKIKTESKAKVKTLNKQIESLRKESDFSGELVQLQNHIAELEDEKGNLQLHLIEIEESTATQEQKIIDFEKTISELQNQKNKAEMKLVELEEQVSSYGCVRQEVSELRLKLEDRENEIKNLKESLSTVEISPNTDLVTDIQKELEEARRTLTEWQCRYEGLEKKLEERNEQVLSDSQKILQTANPDLTLQTEAASSEENLIHKVELLEQSMHEKQIQVQELEALVQTSLEKIENLTTYGIPERTCQNCEAKSQLLAEQEAQIVMLESSVNKPKEENEILKTDSIAPISEVSFTEEQKADQFNSSQTPSSMQSSQEVSDLQRELIEASGELELKRDECNRLESKLRAQVEKAKKIAVTLKVKTVAIKELEERVGKYESVIQSNKLEIEQLSREKQDILEKWQTEMSEKDATLSQAAEKLAVRELDINNLSQELESKSSIIVELESELAALQKHVKDLQLLLEEKSTVVESLNRAQKEQGQQIESDKIAALQAEIVTIQNQLVLEAEEKKAAITKLESFTKQVKLKLAKEKKTRTELLEKQNEIEALLMEKNNILGNIQEQHAKEISLMNEDKERFEVLLKEHQEQASILHQQLEQERSKLQYANENLATTEECFEEAQELDSLPSMESFVMEVEGLCASISPQYVLSVLEAEKTKTMNDLSSSFETLHNQIISRLQNKPNAHGDRKLFAELRNLVTRVINRTAALEHKIKKIVAESDLLISSKLFDAEQSIQALETLLSEARESLNLKESEKLNLEDKVNSIEKERWNLIQQNSEESEKSQGLETQLKEASDKMDSLTQSINSLQQQINEKDDIIQDLEARYQDSLAQSTKSLQQQINEKDNIIQDLEARYQDSLAQSTNSLQQQITEKDNIIQDLEARYQDTLTQIEQARNELHNLQQQNADLNLNLKTAVDECEMWKSKLLTAEQELNDSMLSVSELKVCCNDAATRCENLQQQVAESSHRTHDMQLQLQRATEEAEELRRQLADAVQTLTLKSDTFSQQSVSWTYEKEEFENKLQDVTQQLQAALEQAAKHKSMEGMVTHQSKSGEEESLRQQLAEKTREVENYQRRLIQLQMGASDSSAHFFDHPNEKKESLEVFHMHEKVALHENVFKTQTDASNSILDAFKPAKSLFDGSSTEMNELQTQIQSLTEKLELLLSEKKNLEAEKSNLQSKLDSLSEHLNVTKGELEAIHPTVKELQLKLSEVTGELELSKSCIEQEKLISSKLQDDVKELQCIVENEKYEKEKAECELKAHARTDAEARPSIPQSLDTHVSSLQNSGSSFNNEEKTSAFDEQMADESLMESNITLLESELRGMVTSQRERALKKRSSSENVDSLMSEISELKKQLAQLESEKKVALSQIDTLQAEIKSLSESAVATVSSTNQPLIPENDPLMNDDDSWGWGADSAHLEVQHQQQKNENSSSSDNLIKDLQVKIDLLKEENAALEKDKIQLTEDWKSSQIRAAKLTRKLKELKMKYDEISGKSRLTDSPFDSLDQAIEEERMKQMQGLEKELKEVLAEFNTVKVERDRLQKQVDVFSTANERMLEAKERQDVEVEMWQKRSKDLSNQVQALEWKIRELEESREGNPQPTVESAETPQTSPKPPNSSETLNPIEIDQLLKENHTWNTNYENLMQEYQKLRAQCLADSEQRSQIDALMAQQKGMIERLEHEKTYFQDVYDALKMDYESACAQLSTKQAGEDENTQSDKRAEELEERLSIAEERLEETLAQLQAVSSDNAEFQAQCSQLNEARKQLLLQLEHSQGQLEAKAQEINRLHKNIRDLETKSMQSSSGDSAFFPTPVHDSFVSHETSLQGSSPSSTVLNWGSIVSGGEQPSADIFESIANTAAQGLEEQLHLKDSEMQKNKRMIETLKRTMEESEQEWGQLIEYHKSQLETAKKTITDLQAELQSLKLHATTVDEAFDLKLNENNQVDKCQELLHVIFSKEKEIESLQINLAVSEETKKELEEELQSIKAEAERRPQEIPQKSNESPAQLNVQPSTIQPVFPMSIPVMSSADRNLSNELDHVLYLLHERDVRCEELTLELTQLLEERDGLQLRLSNAIRTNEELRERLKQLLSSQPDDINIINSSSGNLQGQEPAASSNIVENSDVSSSAHAQSLKPEERQIDLQNKLTELRTIGYSHDKRLREDSEYRHHQQMRLLSSSPPTILFEEGNEPSTVNESISGPSQVKSSINTDANNVEQSSSNEPQGSLLGWFWGRN